MKPTILSTPPADEHEVHQEGDASDLWAIAKRPSYDHMARVACEARDLLGALGANVDWLKSVLPDRPALEDIADGLNDLETCCERLRDLVEDALIGTRKQGLSASRAIVSVQSMLAVCVRQVKRRASARQVSIEVVGGELYAMLDGQFLMRATVKLLDHVIRQVEQGSMVQIRYALENDEIRLTVAKFQPGLRSVPPLPSLRAPSLRPTPSMGPARAEPAGQGDDVGDLEFVQRATEAHGGRLTIGPALHYRICLPGVETRLRR